MVRSPSSLKETIVLKKGPWSSEEDEILKKHIKVHGHPNWRALPRLAGLARCGKSCRLRWTNYLQPGIKRGNFTREEEEIIITLHQLLGNRWSAIAAKLPGRTDNEIKNVWHTHLKKKLLNKDIDVQQSSTSTQHSSISNTSNDEDDFILVDESIFDTVWDDHTINQIHHTSIVDDPSCDQSDRNPNDDTLACITSNNHIDNLSSNTLPLQRSNTETSNYNSYNDVLSPEMFLETDESFWSDVLASDHDHNNSCTSSIESYYPCYDESSFSNVGSNQVSNVTTSEYISIENGGDVDDFWFDVLFRAGEHILFS